jgi:hypothetical protein
MNIGLIPFFLLMGTRYTDALTRGAMSTNPYQPPTVPDAMHEQEQPNKPPFTLDSERAGRVMFGVVVRTIGLLSIMYGLWWALYGFLAAFGAVRIEDPLSDYAIAGAISFIAGAFLMRGASLIVSIAYPDNDNDASD